MNGAVNSRFRSLSRRGAAIAIFVWLSALSGPVLSGAPATAVLYPDIREPFRSVFLSISRGVSDEIPNTQLHAITEADSPQDIHNWISANGIQSIVALGSRGQLISDELSDTVPVVIGAVHMSPELVGPKYYGLALSPDPELLLSRLKVLTPKVDRVTLIYHRERDRWMVEQAKGPARRLGIELNAVPVDRLQEAAGAYREALARQKSETEALWLSQDSAVLDEQAVLPMILKEAWDRKLIIFSSNPSHVRRGILFALYPDNESMGRSLGKMAILSHRTDGAVQGMQLLQDLSTAFNVRTAGHLGVRYTREFLHQVDLVFPLR